MKNQTKFSVTNGGDPPSLERLASMLNRISEQPEKTVDCVCWKLCQQEGSIQCQFPVGPGPKEKKNYCDRVGQVLAEYTLSEQEPLMLRKIFRRIVARNEELELDTLIKEAISRLNRTPKQEAKCAAGEGRRLRFKALSVRFSTYLETNENLHLDGFLHFGLKNYCAQVHKAAAQVLEDRLIEQSYEDFMEILKTMVKWQDPEERIIHVLHFGGDDFNLLDEDFQPLPYPNCVPTNVEHHGLEEKESLIVSRLLKACPKKLLLYTPEPNAQVIRTIRHIFGDRVVIQPKQTLT